MKSRAKNFLLSKWGRHCIFVYGLQFAVHRKSGLAILASGLVGKCCLRIADDSAGKKEENRSDKLSTTVLQFTYQSIRVYPSACLLKILQFPLPKETTQDPSSCYINPMERADPPVRSASPVTWRQNTVTVHPLPLPHTPDIVMDQKQEKNNKIFHLGKQTMREVTGWG